MQQKRTGEKEKKNTHQATAHTNCEISAVYILNEYFYLRDFRFKRPYFCGCGMQNNNTTDFQLENSQSTYYFTVLNRRCIIVYILLFLIGFVKRNLQFWLPFPYSCSIIQGNFVLSDLCFYLHSQPIHNLMTFL